MPQRLASLMALLVFVLCLLIGGFGANNGFGTVVSRALLAMAGTFVVALVIGLMGKRMIDESVRAVAAPELKKNDENSSASERMSDR